MFKRNNLIIPQQEHARFAGMLASIWGNENFETPEIGIDTITKGIVFHHNAYGQHDAIDFKSASDEEIEKIFQGDTLTDIGDVDAELINLFHQRRLIEGSIARKARENLRNVLVMVNRAIDEKLKQSRFQTKDFTWADRITNVCDKISFNFSSGEPIKTDILVYPRINGNQQINIVHEITSSGEIYVTPWPFSQSSIRGFIIGYKRENYPEKLAPVLVNYSVISRS